MRLSNILTIFCIVYLSGCASTINSPSHPLHNLAGVYEGTVWSGGVNIPVTTEIFVDKNGNIMGKYEMIENVDNVTKGELYDFHAEGPYTLTASWKDKYGIGRLRMLFSENCYLFKGLWGLNKKDTFLLWDGTKQ